MTLTETDYGLAAAEIKNTLMECSVEVLESMFYCGVLGPAEELDHPYHRYAISFSGTWEGEFAMGMTEDAAAVLAANFAGLDGDADADQMAEVLSELSNILCGAALSRLNRNGIFNLSSPYALAMLPAGGHRVALELEEGTLQATLRLGPVA